MLDAIILFASASEAVSAHGENKFEALVTRFGVDWPYLISQIVSFTVVAYLLYRFAFKPVLATLDERQKKIADGLKYTEEMKSKLADAERQHAETMRKASIEAQKLVDEARTAAKDLLDRETKAATEKTEQMITKAEEAIELERKKMISDVHDEISRLVVLTTQRVLTRELNSEERRRYAESAARELSEV